MFLLSVMLVFLMVLLLRMALWCHAITGRTLMVLHMLMMLLMGVMLRMLVLLGALLLLPCILVGVVACLLLVVLLVVHGV